MKTLLSLLVISLFFAAGPPVKAAERTVLARITVYWRSEGCGLRASSNGARLQNGNCAVDPHRIPFGSKLIFPDAVCTAVDSGPDVVSRKAARSCGRNAAQRNALVVDRFFETKSAALAWSGTHPLFMNIRVSDSGEASRNTSWAATSSAEMAIRVAVWVASPLPHTGCELAAFVWSSAGAAAQHPA